MTQPRVSPPPWTAGLPCVEFHRGMPAEMT